MTLCTWNSIRGRTGQAGCCAGRLAIATTMTAARATSASGDGGPAKHAPAVSLQPPMSATNAATRSAS